MSKKFGVSPYFIPPEPMQQQVRAVPPPPGLPPSRSGSQLRGSAGLNPAQPVPGSRVGSREPDPARPSPEGVKLQVKTEVATRARIGRSDAGGSKAQRATLQRGRN